MSSMSAGLDRPFALAYQVALVRLHAVQREAILLRVDRNRLDAEFVRCAHDAYGDLAAIGDEESLDLTVMAHTPEIIRGAALWYGSFTSFALP